MRRVLYIVRKPPSVAANEFIDMMLVSGVFEQPTSVLFIDDGIRQLNGKQDARLVSRKDTARALAALESYGVAPLYAHGPSLAERGIDPSDVNVPITVVGDAELPSMLDEADVVVTD